MKNLIIAKAEIGDAEEILNLQKLAYLSEAEIYNDYAIPPLTQTLDEIKTDYERQVFLKAIADIKIVGSVRAFMNEGICHIGRLIVHPDFQNKGIGTQLMNEIERFFNKAVTYELFTGYKSKRNIHFYQKLGYKVFGEKAVASNYNLVFLKKYNKVRA